MPNQTEAEIPVSGGGGELRTRAAVVASPGVDYSGIQTPFKNTLSGNCVHHEALYLFWCYKPCSICALNAKSQGLLGYKPYKQKTWASFLLKQRQLCVDCAAFSEKVSGMPRVRPQKPQL